MHDLAASSRLIEHLSALTDELRVTLQHQGESLAETQRRLSTLFERAPMSMQLIDRDGRTLQVNAAWKALWKIPDAIVEGFILRSYNILKDPQLEEKGIAPYFVRALQGENCHIPAALYDATEQGMEGRARWVEGFLYPVKDDAGRVEQLVLMHQDITERKEAEALILRKSAEFEAVFLHLPEPVVMASASRDIVLVNPAACALLGYAPAELVGKPLAFIQHEADGSGGAGQGEADASAPTERHYRHRTGDPILTETTTSVVRTPDGTVLGSVSLVRDIREKRRAERMMAFLSEAGNVLAASLDHPQTLSALARLAVPALGDWCIVDLLEDDGTVRRAEVVVADPAQQPLAAEVVRYAPGRDHLQHPPARALFEARPLLLPRVDPMQVAELSRGDAHARTMAATGLHSMICVPLVARTQTLGVLTLLLAGTKRSYDEKDLSYAKQLASKAAQAVENARLYQRATEAIAARDEFLGVCSHELKTPITSMKLQLQAATAQRGVGSTAATLPPALGKRLEVATRQLRRLEKLIEDMLDVSRIVSGRLTMTLEPLSVRELVADALDQMGEKFAAAGVPLSLQVEADARVQGDRLRLTQVIDNLLSNALKYGEGKPVRVRVHQEGGRSQVAVEDQGPGIAAGDRQRIFKRFERAAATRNIGGLGLGLYISRQIAEAHAGSLEVHSEPGQGARFVLELPLA
ncbi:PAS domain-containing sensor histidine kinase [Aggregicoccus sp. 17bor-14]|uniref:sensor histidine kinase n=1 Tax=Myxococcaceae TaxID=31 RepID=UPI00129CF342|nr:MULTISPECIES: PAS domain-containing sensor histidine kinase [Myxococcaceae]MBF5044624.1 PAS domain-containing sensor histidine kinase [Simulacricoccus sp. 17bor-14]MRI90368.1 PAS domain-containing sensor histidine kinase [Aggregicoccus sp. 17bor-14]